MYESLSFTSEVATPPDVVEGLIREGQLVTVAGSFNVGKSPMLQELAVCVMNGVPFLGRQTHKRPVIYIDLENAGYSIEQNMRRMCDRHGVPYPVIPDQLEFYLLNGGHRVDQGTEVLRQLLKLQEPKDCLSFLQARLAVKPNALVIIDPAEMFFKIDTVRKVPVLELFGLLKDLLSLYPMSVISQSFNLRKAERSVKRPDLLTNPRAWLEEVCGSLDLINRSDVRFGMDFHADEEAMRVINGVRRGEYFEPMVVKPVGESPDYYGFTLCAATEVNLLAAFSIQQKGHWDSLPDSFTFEAATALVPRSSLSRLLDKAKSLGIIVKEGHIWTKSSGTKVKYVDLSKFV